MKEQLILFSHPMNLLRQNAKAVLSAVKAIPIVFQVSQGAFDIDYLEKGKTVTVNY